MISAKPPRSHCLSPGSGDAPSETIPQAISLGIAEHGSQIHDFHLSSSEEFS